MTVESTPAENRIPALTGEQRAALTAGESGWRTRGEPAVGLAGLVMGDGPLGLVSPTFDERDTAFLLPAGIALGATWSRAVLDAVGRVQGSEAHRAGYSAVYAPNLNLIRSGLSGRSFEMLSEDPVLAGTLGAAFIQALQGQGVAAAPKHFVCNDSETERQKMSATVDDTSLREVYLRPFELAVAAGAWAVMTAYNRVNGTPCAENSALLSILKDEWGFDGLVVSDYFALQSTDAPAMAGLDLEMPGPGIHFGAQLARAVQEGRVPQSRVDDAVERLLRLAGRVGALDGAQRAPVLAERTIAEDASHAHLIEAACAAATLVQNDDHLLPLRPEALTRLAVIGPNATRPAYQGATFGRVRPRPGITTPEQAIRDRFTPRCEVRYEPGTLRTRPEPLGGFTVHTPDGRPGLLLQHLATDDSAGPLMEEVRADSSFIWFGRIPGVGPTTQPTRLRLTAVFTPDSSGEHTFAAGGSGATTLTVDGEAIAHRPAPAPADVMGEVARAEMTPGTVHLTAGVPVTLTVDMISAGARVCSLTVGCLTPQAPGARQRALTAAADADAVVVVVGDSLETSRESRDLDSSALPADHVDLITAVAAVNSRVVVVVNAGRPVHTPWAGDVSAVLFSWLPGQGFAEGLAAVLAGDVEPGGRLPVTIPCADTDRSTYGEQLSPDLELDYTSVEPTGYRHLQRANLPARYCFGHGLGYTTWSYDTAALTTDAEGRVLVDVTVTNTGDRAGRTVIQVYLRGPGEADARLVGFTDASSGAGESSQARITLTDRAFQRWNTPEGTWHSPPGEWELRIGRSADDIALTESITR